MKDRRTQDNSVMAHEPAFDALQERGEIDTDVGAWATADEDAKAPWARR